MKHSSSNRSSLFLLEIIIAILFFSMVSAVCLRAFAKSHTLSQQASDMNSSISNMENVAELLRSVNPGDLTNSDSISETLQTIYPELSMQDNTWDIYFDSDWKSCSAAEAAYEITIADISSGPADTVSSVCTFRITAGRTSDDQPIEQLTLKLHAKE